MEAWINIAFQSLGKATPILLACLGGLLSELSGIINFALEGMMIMGAFCAVWAAHASGSPWVGLAGGALGGMGVGLLHALATVTLRVNQIVSSIALNLLAAGLSGMLLNQVFGVYGTSPTVNRLPTLNEALSAFIPPAGEGGVPSVAGYMSITAPMALLLGFFSAVLLGRTVWGLRLLACGESPMAARASGIRVEAVQILAVVAGGAMAGLGGAALSIGALSQFVEHMTQGRGYLAIAALILGGWRPYGVMAAALFFGFSDALAEWMAVRWPQAPQQTLLALPYLACLTIMALWGKRAASWTRVKKS